MAKPLGERGATIDLDVSYRLAGKKGREGGGKGRVRQDRLRHSAYPSQLCE